MERNWGTQGLHCRLVFQLLQSRVMGCRIITKWFSYFFFSTEEIKDTSSNVLMFCTLHMGIFITSVTVLRVSHITHTHILQGDPILLSSTHLSSPTLCFLSKLFPHIHQSLRAKFLKTLYFHFLTMYVQISVFKDISKKHKRHWNLSFHLKTFQLGLCSVWVALSLYSSRNVPIFTQISILC